MWRKARKMSRRKTMFLQKIVTVLLLGSLVLTGSLAFASPPTLRITIGTFAPYYSPKSVHISTDTPISWSNLTHTLHSITHDDCRNGVTCAFDSGPLGPKGIFTVQNLRPGLYRYHCSFHPIMRGVLIVTGHNSANET